MNVASAVLVNSKLGTLCVCVLDSFLLIDILCCLCTQHPTQQRRVSYHDKTLFLSLLSVSAICLCNAEFDTIMIRVPREYQCDDRDIRRLL